MKSSTSYIFPVLYVGFVHQRIIIGVQNRVLIVRMHLPKTSLTAPIKTQKIYLNSLHMIQTKEKLSIAVPREQAIILSRNRKSSKNNCLWNVLPHFQKKFHCDCFHLVNTPKCHRHHYCLHIYTFDFLSMVKPKLEKSKVHSVTVINYN